MKDTELLLFINKPVDLKRLVRKVTFDLDDLERAAQQQQDLRLEAGRFKAQAALLVANRKRRLLKVVGRKSLKIRHREDKVTESSIKNSLSLDSKVQSLQKKYDNAEVYYEAASQVVEVFKERAMMLSILTRLRASEISSNVASVQGKSKLKDMKKRARRAANAFDMDDGDIL